jgi:hypothetical protein
VQRVFYARSSTTEERRREVNQGVWEFEHDADTPTLSFRYLPFNAGDTIEVEVLRPANTWIRHDGVWGDASTPVDATSVGLQEEGDAALYDVVSVVAQARPIALQRLSLLHAVGSKERGLYQGESESDTQKAALARWFGGFRGSGVQRVGSLVQHVGSLGRSR